jgi:hypothetical protein
VDNRESLAAALHNRGMLRLDPAFPPLWRSTSTLQFGVDAVAVVDDPAPWQLRLIRELEHGIPDAALDPVAVAFGAPDDVAAEFVRGIGRALVGPGAPPLRVVLQAPYGFAPDHADAVAAVLESTGLKVTPATWFDAHRERMPRGAPVVLLAHHVIDLRRSAALMAQDVAHVPLVFTGPTVEIGPYVVPGETACLACVAAYRRDADPAWPVLAAQLIGRRAPDVSAAFMSEAALVTARLISEAAQRPLRCHSLTLREHSLHRAMRGHRPHADCRCRSLAEISTPADLARPVPTRVSELALPA